MRKSHIFRPIFKTFKKRSYIWYTLKLEIEYSKKKKKSQGERLLISNSNKLIKTSKTILIQMDFDFLTQNRGWSKKGIDTDLGGQTKWKRK